MQLAVRWVTLSVLLAGVPALRLINSDFPSHVIRGTSLNMSCDYDADGEKIYLVKWYKNDEEFYNYSPEHGGKTYYVLGVKVNVNRSTSRSVLLESVDLSSEGTYSCEITVDQTFDTVIAYGSVTVVELPQRGPVISGIFLDSVEERGRIWNRTAYPAGSRGQRHREKTTPLKELPRRGRLNGGVFLNNMDEGDRVVLNCTVYRSRPAAKLTWYINGARSDSRLLRRYQSVADVDDLKTVTLGLDFSLRRSHFGPAGQVTLKCTAEIESVFYSSADVHITSRTMAMLSRMGSGHVHWPFPPLEMLSLLASYFLWLHGV